MIKVQPALHLLVLTRVRRQLLAPKKKKVRFVTRYFSSVIVFIVYYDAPENDEIKATGMKQGCSSRDGTEPRRGSERKLDVRM